MIGDRLRERLEKNPKVLQWVILTLRAPADAAAVREAIRQLGGEEPYYPAPADAPLGVLYARLNGDVIRSLAQAEQVKRIEADDGRGFEPENLVKTVISEPLLSQVNAEPEKLYPVIINLNLDYFAGRNAARDEVMDMISAAGGDRKEVRSGAENASHPYVFTRQTGTVIRRLAQIDKERSASRGPGGPAYLAIYRIWEDSEVHALISRSISTVKADAAQISFSARGNGIVWAVLDSGIDEKHPHFQKYRNLDLPPQAKHCDFTSADHAPLSDPFGHGTHVAGIIAGCMDARDGKAPRAIVKRRDDDGGITYDCAEIPALTGMAPEARLVSMKVLDDRGRGRVSYIIDALEEVQKVNDYGRRLVIHGVNLSVGYEFDPEWFACGQSPLCVEVNRLVRSGVSVVVAAGNTGYGYQQPADRTAPLAGYTALSINDPGNAELAVTVGSTHREMPHTYGVSYFSSKGPTGDGRPKPDLVAPGERVISCATGVMKAKLKVASAKADDFDYMEDSGTSMAAPHVSGVIAAFLSVRGEFIGEPEKVKQIFTSSATDLGRDRSFQGCGLVDLMRAIQSV